MRRLASITCLAIALAGCTVDPVVIVADWQIDRQVADGDYLLPRLSPDASRLAYAEVVVVDDRESSQLWVMDLATDARTLLLDGRAVARHGHYRATAVDLEWVGDGALMFSIHDGDMDVLALTVDAESGDSIRSSRITGPVPGPTPVQAVAARRMLDLLPELGGPPQIQSVFWRPHVFLNPDSVLLRRHDDEYGSSLWLADLGKGTLSVMDPSWPSHGSLAGGVSMNAGLAVLFRTTDGEVDVLRYSHGAIEELSTFPAGRSVDAREVGRSETELVFLLLTRHPSETGTNHLLVFDGETVWPLIEREGLVDADLAVTSTGRLLAIAVWKDGKRVLEVHR